MKGLRNTIDDLRLQQASIKFSALAKICTYWFGPPRFNGGSHKVYKMPWPGDPRVNIQRADSGMAKVYQVRQAISALINWRKNMEKHEHYTYRITWSAEDNEYVGLCTEFPSLSWLATTRTAALDGIENLVSDVIADMLAQGETPPEALAEKNFSGKLVLRMTPEQHRRLAINAMDEGVSLNRYLCARLAG